MNSIEQIADKPSDQTNPYLEGPYAPIRDELIVEGLPVNGELPASLDGTYMRIGPNPITPPDGSTHHWFAGDGMIHAVRIKDGKALWYRNRYIRSNQVSEVLGEPPAPGPRHERGDTVNTNVISHAGKILALIEAGGYPVEVDSLLGTKAYTDLDGSLKLGGFTAHPHPDPDTGELHAICYDAGNMEFIRHVVIGQDGLVRREMKIPMSGGPMIHDCALTERFVLIFDMPVTFSVETAKAGMSVPYVWNPEEHPARVGLLPREGTADEIIWCSVEPGYVFHPCNAYDLPDGRVVVDVAVHDRLFAEGTEEPGGSKVTFERWTCDLGAKTVDRQVTDSVPQEFPRYDERLTGKPYRYAYTVTLDEGRGPPFSGVIAHDMETGERKVHDFGADCIPGEFVFVPRSPDSAENDGWMIGYVLDVSRNHTDFVVLDAKDVSADPVATIPLPQLVPLGFHGNWIPAEAV
ncbi:carotenoid oxygenase family protein [Alterisphingorhabdus coralli]|uniref:Dioxygenase n=1 Tax=Alterisphingorhabdus coralli TaxID=3071408 RepID=A0AA97I1T9_9SPHN|nr:carotenoid oxygenase family protein [Parasphingorhabdus sp. SCSIO 66989]WOE75645.1 carotenoid oxygenase family protein [Parasphingorhabdus sp. SCSIO 66989]